ncbi:MAG: hypothetical protein AAF945_16385 [Actinomycetota bacterium]
MSNIHTYTGILMIDEGHRKVGTITDALYDDRDGQAADPRWLVVDPGILRSERLVPAAGSWETESGELVIPFDKGWVKDAPTVSSDHVVDAVTEKAAIDHYGLPN